MTFRELLGYALWVPIALALAAGGLWLGRVLCRGSRGDD